MTDSSVADGEDRDPPVPQKPRHEGLSIGLFVIFAMMLWLVVISVAYAVSMIGFLGDDGYFLAYGSLCGTVPVVAAIDQYAPFAVAAMWLVAAYLGLTRTPGFYRYAFTASLVSMIYGAIDIVIGPFTFRVGPADFDPSTAVCGRWPRDVTQLPDLSVMHIDWLGMPISIFGLSLLFLGLTVFVYLRISRRVKATYRHRPMPSGAA